MHGSILSTLTATNVPTHDALHTLLLPPSPSTWSSSSEENCGWSHSISSWPVGLSDEAPFAAEAPPADSVWLEDARGVHGERAAAL